MRQAAKQAAVLALSALAAWGFVGASKAAARKDTGATVTYIARTDAYVQKEYLDWYGIPADPQADKFILNYSFNGGNYGSNLPQYAFDGNFDTFWETNTVNSENFKNQITVEFNKDVTADRIVFATRRDGQWQKGFPCKATFSLSNDGKAFTAFAVCSAEVKNNLLLYTFSEPFTARYFRFEYTEIYDGMTQHASASELIFLQPEEDFVHAARNLFADYMHTKLLPAFDDEEAILSLRRQLTGHPLRDELEENLGRALQILDGSLLTDPVNRQFTTDPKGRGVRLQQRGDIAAYGRKLHYMFGLSNYLPTGICGNTGEKLTVYVEADEGQPLPRAVFTQFLTKYNHWQGSQIQLHRGVNILTVPAFTYTPSYTNPGGPLYLVNPYTPQEQNESVKIYIEGGHLYPVFYKGGSEEKFKNDLHDFLEYYEENKDTAHNVAEVMSDHMLVTAQATRAGEIYLDDGVSVQKACENWDEYMRSLLLFNGHSFEKDSLFYDPRIENLYLNVRVMQPFSAAADAYATGQHVGIRINTGWEAVALRGSGFGWGTSHEIGHIIEIGECRVLEYTNNMVSNYNETVLDGQPSRGDHAKITRLLAPDSVIGTGGIGADGSYDNTYVVWWNIESVFPGYWGRYNELFRYGVPAGYPSADGMSAIEKQVYYTSIAVGLDTGYYFDRYGYRFNDVPFVQEEASQAYKNAVSKLKAEGKLSDKQLKFWYVGPETATLNYVRDDLAIYDESMTVHPLYIHKEEGGYRFGLPDRSDEAGYLGYEILEGDRVIGFTSSASFFDGTVYDEGYVPRYRICAYDQKLNHTARSEVWDFGAETPAAGIGDRTFLSLHDALSAAADNDTILLLRDIAEEGLEITRNITLTNGGKTVMLLKTGDESIFRIAEGATLAVRGSENAPHRRGRMRRRAPGQRL